MNSEKTVAEYADDLTKYFKAGDANAMRELSNETMDRAAFAEDRTLVSISLVSYALGKLLSKPHLLKIEQWADFKAHILADFEKKEPLDKVLDHIKQEITAFDADVGNYLVDVIQKARIKQASRAYAMGLSLSKAAELTGADTTELLSYVGATKIHDRPFTQTKPVIERFAATKKVFE
jgi:hypothetical protein